MTSKTTVTGKQKPQVIKFITVMISRHADFGGGMIEADLPDTPYHRHYYTPIRQWSEIVVAE